MARDKNIDWFKELGVTPDASTDEIDEAYDKIVEENRVAQQKGITVEERLAGETKVEKAKEGRKILTDPTRRDIYYKEYLARRSAEAGNPKVTQERRFRPETLGQAQPLRPSRETTSNTSRPVQSSGGLPLPPTRAPLVPNAIASRIPMLGKFNNLVNSTVGKVGGAVSKALKPLTSAASKLLAPLLAKIGPLLAKLAGAIAGGPIGAALAVGSILATYGKDLARGTVALIVGASGAAVAGAVSGAAVTAGIALAVLGVTVPLIMFIINSGAYIVPATTAPLTEYNNITLAACFKLNGEWPPTAAETMAAATQRMVAEPSYVQKLCAAGDILLEYRPDLVAYGGLTATPSLIYFGTAGVSSVGSAFYTLAHESGHVLARRTNIDQLYFDQANLFQERNNPPSIGDKKGVICTYPIPITDPYFADLDEASFFYVLANESFAEMIALYYGGDSPASLTRNFGCLTGGSLRTAYPEHYSFAGSNIFN